MLAPQPSSSSEPPVKLACATCIQGHRASSCKHQDGSKGPLLVVKRRGRPLSQCQACREKRFKTGRHTRCICDARPRNARSKQTEIRDSSARSATSPLSFANILNPCQCKGNGICTCCDTNSFYGTMAKSECKSSCTSCGPSQACKEESTSTPSSAASPSTPDTKSASPPTGCCRPRVAESDPELPSKRRREDSMNLLAQAADMSRPYTPPCTCGPSCQCSECYQHTQGRTRPLSSSMDRSTAPPRDCNSCVACDIQLRNPSGIPYVDRWSASDSTMLAAPPSAPMPSLSLARPV